MRPSPFCGLQAQQSGLLDRRLERSVETKEPAEQANIRRMVKPPLRKRREYRDMVQALVHRRSRKTQFNPRRRGAGGKHEGC